MNSFEGDFRRKPQQSLRGASKKEDKELLLKNAKEKRERREEQRTRQENALKIQKFYRGYRIRKQQREMLRRQFDQLQGHCGRGAVAVDNLQALVSLLCHFYADDEDGGRLVWLCQQLVKNKDAYIQFLQRDLNIGQQQVKRILQICLMYLVSISGSNQPIAIPMRMLEVFTSQASFPDVTFLKAVWNSLLENEYFDHLRTLLNNKVPASLEKSREAPTPMAASIFDLIMSPVKFASKVNDRMFSNHVLGHVCKSLLCPAYSDQISKFLIPAMAYSKYPFPFVDLITMLLTQFRENEVGEGKNTGYGRTVDRKKVKIEVTPYLLGAFVALGKQEIGKLRSDHVSEYLQVLQRLLPTLQPVRVIDEDDDDDSDDEMEFDDGSSAPSGLEEVREECLEALDTASMVIRVATIANQGTETLYALSVICHCLMSEHRFSINKRRLLYTLAYNTSFIKNLWKFCRTQTTLTATRTETPLILLLSRGLTMTERDVKKIVPVLSTFCSMFSHSLHTLHDAEFFGDERKYDGVSSMPFHLEDVMQMVIGLRDVCLGIIELAHPDSRPQMNEDYRLSIGLGGIRRRDDNMRNSQQRMWEYLFKVTATLVRQIYTRDARRPFCVKDLWLSERVNIDADKPSQIYQSHSHVFSQRPFVTMQSLTRMNDEHSGPPLSNRDVKQLVILTELPFVVPFTDRVKILQKFIQNDRQENQGEMDQFGNASINVLIRRNYIYEDAFEKLSIENEPNLKKKMKVQLINAAGMDEAGIDGGGIFREFLNVLLKTSFDPNRGFFSQTTDRLLFPSAQASAISHDYLNHYFFLGRMLGKALYENMLVELPFASFFLSKILSRHSGDLDIHHLASLDPEMYKNLLFLKYYDGDVTDLGLDFTVANSQFGETSVEELKPGGRNIPVTASNRIEYIHLMADYKLNKQIKKQCMSFREGLSDLINLEWLRMFDQQELQVLISGASIPIDVDDLKQHTNYSGGYSLDHPVIKMFWSIVEEMTDVQKGQLLKFITSCSRPPLLGFKELYPAFCIHYGGNEMDRLPTASTCMNLLKLPECNDFGTLRSKLLYAIESGAGFELS